MKRLFYLGLSGGAFLWPMNNHAPAEQKHPIFNVIDAYRNDAQNKLDVDLVQYKRKFTQANSPRDRAVSALALGTNALRHEKLKSALQYLSAASKLLTPDDSLQAVIKLYLAEAKLNYGAYRAVLSDLQELMGTTKLPMNLSRKAYDLMIESAFNVNEWAKVTQLYDIYKTKFPKIHHTDKITRLAAMSLEKTGRFADAFEALEKLAGLFPITSESRWAFERLNIYNTSGSSKVIPRYYFSASLLKRLSINRALDPQLPLFISSQLDSQIRTSAHKVEQLNFPRKVEYLMRLNLFEKAFTYVDALRDQLPTARGKDHEQILLTLAKIHSVRSEHAIAIDYLTRSLAAHARSPRARKIKEAIAEEQHKMGNFEASAQTYESIAKGRHSSHAKWEEFWNTYRSGNYQRALALLNDPNLRSKDAIEPYAIDYWRGRILEKNKDEAGAEKAYLTVLDKDASSYYANLVLARHPYLISRLKQNDIPTEEARQVDLLENSARLNYASAVASNDSQYLGNETSTEVRTINELLQAGLLNDAHRKLRSLEARRFANATDRESLGRLAEKLSDFRFSRDLSLSNPGLDIVRWNFWQLKDNQKKNSNDWRLLYPLAYEEIVNKVASLYEINKHLLLSIMRAESRFNRDAESGVGARGLMQIMPKTAVVISDKISNPRFAIDDLYDPAVNISYGGFYLNYLLAFYSNNLFLAISGYNAGPKATNNWFERCKGCEADEFVESIPYQETRQYVKKVIRNFGQYSNVYPSQAALNEIPKLPGNLPDRADIF